MLEFVLEILKVKMKVCDLDVQWLEPNWEEMIVELKLVVKVDMLD